MRFINNERSIIVITEHWYFKQKRRLSTSVLLMLNYTFQSSSAYLLAQVLSKALYYEPLKAVLSIVSL